MSALRAIPSWGLTGGLNSQLVSPLIPDNQSDSLGNVVLSNDGKLTPRPGLVTLPASYPALSKSAYHFSKLVNFSAVTTLMSASLDTVSKAVKIYKNVAGIWNDLTGGLTPTGNEDIYPTHANFKGKWFFTPGTSNLLQWDGAAGSVSQVTNADPTLRPPTNPKIVMSSSSGSQLFLLNYVDSSSAPAPQGVSWSGFLDETAWNGGVNGNGSGSQLLADDNEAITAGTMFGPFAIVFKARSMYIATFSGAPTYFQFVRREEDRGCVAQGSIGSYNNMRIWLGDDNVYLFDGNTVQAIGDRILQRFMSQLNPIYANRAIAMVDRYNGRYHLLIPYVGTSFMRKIFSFDFSEGAWTEGTLDNSISPVSSYVYRTGNWAEQLILGDRRGNFFQYTPDASSDNGATFLPFWEGKVYDAVQIMQGQAEALEVDGLHISATSGEIRCKLAVSDYYEDLESQFEDLGVQVADGRSAIEMPARGRGRFFKVRFEWPSVVAGAQIQGYTLRLKPIDGRSGR